MAHIDRHAPGTFCWIELATTDQDAAKTFYSSTFGWSVNDFPMGPGEVYTMFQLDGRDAAAAYAMRPEQRSQGVPSHWMLYVCVTSADDAVKRAQELGGKVLAPAFDVMDFGRMAVIQDPTGAVFSVWQPMTHIGTRVTGVDGTICWADVSTPDAEAASKFYGALFGWGFEPGDSGYLHIKNGEELIGGVPTGGQRNPHAPPHWLPYFLTSSVDDTARKAKQGGGTFHLPPTTMENVGRMSVIADPQGAVFALFQPLRKG